MRERDERISLLGEDIRVLTVARAELRMQLDEERRSASDKLALLDRAQQMLSDAFKALSADALKQNSSSFLELATTSLERFQAGAHVDLEARQAAIVAVQHGMILAEERSRENALSHATPRKYGHLGGLAKRC